MGLRDRLEAGAARIPDGARRAVASAPGQLAVEGVKGLGAMASGGDKEVPAAERFLVALVQAVREDGEGEGRGARDVYVAARKRRRRLALLSFGAGPFAGVANQIADLYCETAVVSDLACHHGVELSDEEIAAHLLVLWDVIDDYGAAVGVVGGDPPLASLLALRLQERAGEQLPDQLTKRSLTKALWQVRGATADARRDAVKTAMFTGQRTKQVIRRAEEQLRVGGARSPR